MLEPLFNKVPSLQACNFIKKRLQLRCFLLKFAKFLRTSILNKCFWQLAERWRNLFSNVRSSHRSCSIKRLFLNVSQYSQPEDLDFMEKEIPTHVLSVNNAKFLRTPILKSISERLLLQRESWNFSKIIEVIETLFEIDDALDRLFVSDDLEVKNLPRKLLGLFYKLRKS